MKQSEAFFMKARVLIKLFLKVDKPILVNLVLDYVNSGSWMTKENFSFGWLMKNMNLYTKLLYVLEISKRGISKIK